MPQHTRLVTCNQNSKAIHYRWKFINSKETGSQEPSGRDSSHKYQVPMISPIRQIPMIRNKQSLKEKVVSTVERNHHIPKVSVRQRRQSASSVGRKGIRVLCADQRGETHVSMSYKPSLLQLPRPWTAYWMNTSQFTASAYSSPQDNNSGKSQSPKIRTSHPPIITQPGVFITNLPD